MKLNEITPLLVLDFFRQKQQDNVSAKTMLNLYILLRKMLSLAVDLDLLSANPLRRVPKPKVERQEKPTLSPTQVRRVIDAVPEKYRALLVVLYFYGLRVGEALGLKWKDVDFASAKLYLRRSIWRGREQSPKSQRSIRVGFLVPCAAAALQRHWQFSPYTQPEDYVFANDAGRPLDLNNVLTRVLYPALEVVGINRTTPRAFGTHLFRHSAGSHVTRKPAT